MQDAGKIQPNDLASTESDETTAPENLEEPAAAQTPTPEPTPLLEKPQLAPSDLGPDILLDKENKRIEINKKFFKSFSPRFYYVPFSIKKEVEKATRKAIKKGYKLPASPMILDTASMFLGHVLIEVLDPDPQDKHIVSLENEEFHIRNMRHSWGQIRTEIAEIEKELGQPIEDLYIYHAGDQKLLLAH